MRRTGWLAWTLMAAVALAGCTAELPREHEVAPEGGSPGGSAPAAGGAGSRLVAFENADKGYRIQRPAGWAHTTLLGLDLFVSPGTTPDRPGASLNIIVTEAGPVTLEDLRGPTLEGLRRSVTDFRLIESREATLGGAPAHQLAYEGRQGLYALTWHQVFAVHAGDAFVVTFATVTERAADFAAEREAILRSFQFTGTAGPAAAPAGPASSA